MDVIPRDTEPGVRLRVLRKKAEAAGDPPDQTTTRTFPARPVFVGRTVICTSRPRRVRVRMRRSGEKPSR